MSEKNDVLVVMRRDATDATRLRSQQDSAYARRRAAESAIAVAYVAELIAAAGDYFTCWCKDEADSPNDGIGLVCGPEQHKAAVRLRDALARVRSS